MNNQELQELSNKVSEKFKLFKMIPDDFGDKPPTYELRDDLYKDLATVMRLAIKHGVWYEFDEHNRYVLAKTHREYFVAHHTREQAVIVAVLKALLGVEV
jgi:hypothetical protein